jgi:hypothetical protein
LAATVTNERGSASRWITMQAGAMLKKRTQNPRGQPHGGSTPPGTKSQQLGSLLRSGGQFGPVSCAHFCAQRCLAILYSACATCGGSSAHGYVDPSSLHQLDALVSNVRGTPNRQQETADLYVGILEATVHPESWGECAERLWESRRRPGSVPCHHPP